MLRYLSGTRAIISRPFATSSTTSLLAVEGPSWVTLHPTPAPPPSVISRARRLRLSGNASAAHSLLLSANAVYSHHTQPVLELLRCVIRADCFKHPPKRLDELSRIWALTPARGSPTVGRLILSTCFADALRVEGDATIVLAEKVWSAGQGEVDGKTAGLMLRLLGVKGRLMRAEQVWEDVKRRGVRDGRAGWEEVVSGWILCLGELGRVKQAERIYFGPEVASLRTSDKVLRALFIMYLVANRIPKAESLIAVYGSRWLDVSACNAFVKKCATSRMLDTAMEFVQRMARSDGSEFPAPNARTYNLLLRGLSAGTGVEDRVFAPARALQIVEDMKSLGIEPTTVTYNTVIRSFIVGKQVDEAFEMYRRMEKPNRVTFSHLMQGAAIVNDLSLANEVYSSLIEADERPNYGFCKSYLEVVARNRGIDKAFKEAGRIAGQLGNVMVFGDVSSTEVIRMALISACGKIEDLPSAFQALKFNLQSRGNDPLEKLESGHMRPGELGPLYVATVLMQVCLACNQPGRALEVFYSMKAAGIEPNFEVYESLIYGLCSYTRGTVVDETRYGGDVKIEDKHKSFMDKVEEGIDISEMSGENGLQIAVELLREMHMNGHGRIVRQAAYVYNALISAASELGDFELALQIFHKMSTQANRGVIYFSAGRSAMTSPCDERASINDTQRGLAELVSTGMFENGFKFPGATVGTYNSMMDAAWRCGEPLYAFEVFEVMQTSRVTEPNVATLSLMSDIALSEADVVGEKVIRGVLQELDRMKIVSKEVAAKRVRLRKKVLEMRWGGGSQKRI